MKQFGCLFLTLVAFFLGAGGLAAKSVDSAEKLRYLVAQACKAKDAAALEQLVCWTGVSSKMQKRMKKQLAVIAGEGVTNVSLAPLPADRPLTNELNGVLYLPNVHVVGVLNLKMEGEDEPAELPYGDREGAFFISAVVEETEAKPKVPAPEPPSH